MMQKIIKVGNSLAFTIPKSFINETGFQPGDELFVQQDPSTKSLIITTEEHARKMQLSPDLFSWLNTMEDKHSEAIKELAKK